TTDTVMQDDEPRPAPTQVDHADPGVLLANLQQDLSRQLSFLKSTPWDLSVLSITAGPTNGAGPAAHHGKDADGFNPVSSILNSTTEFLAISRRLRMPEDTAAGGSSSSSASSAQHPGPRTNPPGKSPARSRFHFPFASCGTGSNAASATPTSPDPPPGAGPS